MRRFLSSPSRWLLVGAILGGAVAIVWYTGRLQAISQRVRDGVKTVRGKSAAADVAAEGAGQHAGHDHSEHAHAHDDPNSLTLSDQARLNVGLTAEFLQSIELREFQRSLTLPAIVVERPGRSRVQVTTPMTGVVTQVYAVQGEAVEPGALLFQIRLTHEDLVQAQTDFLKSLGELDVEDKEVARLTAISESGAVAGKTLLERQYARDKLKSLLKAQRESLRLHGLSDRQVDQIVKDRRLLRELRIYAPTQDGASDEELKLGQNFIERTAYSEVAQPKSTKSGGKPHPLILQELNCQKGQALVAGEKLCVLADYSELYIEGQAFDQDVELLTNAANKGWKVTAMFEEPGHQSWIVDSLEIVYLSNKIDPETRTLQLFVGLPNTVTLDSAKQDGKRFITWKYRPGQRLQIRVPVEQWQDQIVVPVDAVAREGVDSFLFRENGKRFERMPVHVKYRDQLYVVIENDGSVFPGDVVALRGAHQMQMALKNKAGGGVDPHAGHNH